MDFDKDNVKNFMKIGILTFHRAHNYGAVLQCYALQETLKAMGYDVCVIDYRQSFIEALYRAFRYQTFFRMFIHPRGMYYYVKNLPIRIRTEIHFKDFRKKYINTSVVVNPRKECFDRDIYIVGSDQLWGIHCTNGLDSVYFGDFKRKNGSLLIGYAISGTIQSLNKISDELLKYYASKFDILSFREIAISEEVKKRIDIGSRVDLDPTLLTEPLLWESMIDLKWKDKKYVLVYQVRVPQNKNNLLVNKAKIIAKSLDCEVIDLSNTSSYTPSDFVSLFKYAQYVVTSSFHACVFSIIFKRPLYAVKLNDNHDERYVNLLHLLGADECLVDLEFEPKIVNRNYDEVYNKLKILRQASLDYLNSLMNL